MDGQNMNRNRIGRSIVSWNRQEEEEQEKVKLDTENRQDKIERIIIGLNRIERIIIGLNRIERIIIGLNRQKG